MTDGWTLDVCPCLYVTFDGRLDGWTAGRLDAGRVPLPVRYF